LRRTQVVKGAVAYRDFRADQGTSTDEDAATVARDDRVVVAFEPLRISIRASGVVTSGWQYPL
jgi:hypothetical protein